MNILEAESADSTESQLRERIAQHLGKPAYEGAPQVSDLPDKLPAYRRSNRTGRTDRKGKAGKADESKGLYVVALFHGTTLVLNREPGEREIRVRSQINAIDPETKPGWWDCSELIDQIIEAAEITRKQAIKDLDLANLTRHAHEHKMDPIQVLEIFAEKVQKAIRVSGVENEHTWKPGVEHWNWEQCVDEALEEAPKTKQAVKQGGMIM